MKRRTIFLALSVVVLIFLANSGYRYWRSRQAPLPNRWASLSQNYDAVSADVKRHFPKIINTGHYQWDNGYLMYFGVKQDTTPRAYARRIVEYAYPRWVMIRCWSGMPQEQARGCKVFVSDDRGILLADKALP